jgi:hypothetical protein
MKVLFLALLLMTSLSSAFAETHSAASRSNVLLRFIASYPGLRSFGLYTLLANRCNHYLNYDQASRCRGAVAKQIDILDFDMVLTNDKGAAPPSFAFVAFKKDLIKLLGQSRTTDYLNYLNEHLNRYLVGEEKNLNIWEATVKFYGNPYDAAKALALLFQDTSLSKLHLAYLERTNTPGKNHFTGNKALLSKVIDTINLILDYSESSYGELFYPKIIRESLNRNIYHFYVPLYLAMALEKSGTSKKYSFIASLMLTLTYEFITTARDYRYLFTDPEKLEPTQHLGKLKDIYGGYSGSLFGVHKENTLTSLEHMNDNFGKSSSSGVHLLLNHSFK